MTVLQTSPNLGLTLRMQRTTAPAPAPTTGGGTTPTGGVMCSGWLVPWLCQAPEAFLSVEDAPGGGFNIWGSDYDSESDIDYGALMSSLWVGTPAQLDGSGRPRPIPSMGPIPGSGFACLRMQVNTTYTSPFPGRLFMALAAPGGTWSAAWEDAPSDPLVSASGHRAQVVGGTLSVHLMDTDGSINASEVLVATAYDGDTQIAQLLLTAVRMAF
ncbi:MAG: hypothetical protein EOO29_16100 [Comamonadaceae bacterium]|nr:MAG: hypothetical protein EOO29_16100 [Comamonadaceae bacterium]